MLYSVAKRLRCGTLIALIICYSAAVSSAGTISMYLTDFDVTYLGSAPNGGALYDAIALPGGFLVTTDADELQAASFKVDSTPIGTIVDSPSSTSDDMWGDLKVDGVGGTMPRNTINFNRGSNGGTFGFDWFIKSGTTLGNFLRLGLTSVNVTLTDGTLGPGSEMSVAGIATVLSQNLPFGLAFDTSQPVTFTFSAPKPGISGGNPATAAIGSGSMTITGIQVPEPVSFALLCFGGLALGIGNVRRHRKTRAV